jgi:hypothetical protein
LGLYLASGASDRRRLALAGLVTCAALFTKQTVISVPVGVCIALLLTGPRSLSWFLLGLLVPAGALLTLFAAATDGEFIRHVVTGNAGNPTNLARLVRFELEFALLHPLLLIGGLGFALSQLVARRPSPLATSTLVAFVVSLSVASEASSVNYFMELVPLTSAAAAVAWTRFAAPDAGRAMLAAGLVVVQLAIVFHVPNIVGVWPSFFAPHGYTPTMADAAVGREIDATIRDAPGWVISEPAGFAVRNGKDVLLQPLDLRAEQLRGRWSSDRLRQAVRERRFSVVVVSFGLFPEDVLTELRSVYVLDRTVMSPNGLRYSVYRPGS